MYIRMSASQRLGFMEVKHRLQSLENQVASLTNLCTTFAHQIRYLKNSQDGNIERKTSNNQTLNNQTSQTIQHASNNVKNKPLVNNFTQNTPNTNISNSESFREISLSKSITGSGNSLRQSTSKPFVAKPSTSEPLNNVEMKVDPVVKPKRKYTRRKKPEKPSQTINIE